MKLSFFEDFQTDFQSNLVITPVYQNGLSRTSKRIPKFSKFTVKLPSVENEKSMFMPLKAPIPHRSHSLSKLKHRSPAYLTPNVIRLSIAEELPQTITRYKSTKKVKTRNISTAKEKYTTDHLDDSLAFKISNIMIPLPYTETRIIENKRHSHRLRMLRRIPTRFDKENEINNL